MTSKVAKAKTKLPQTTWNTIAPRIPPGQAIGYGEWARGTSQTMGGGKWEVGGGKREVGSGEAGSGMWDQFGSKLTKFGSKLTPC